MPEMKAFLHFSELLHCGSERPSSGIAVIEIHHSRSLRATEFPTGLLS